MLIGLVTMSELLRQMETRREASVVHLPKPAGRDDSRVTREDARLMVAPDAGGSVIGTLVGIIPGRGPTMGAFLGDAAAWRLATRRDAFCKGSVAGRRGAAVGNNTGRCT